MSKIYLIGALKNQKVPALGKLLRSNGHEVFDEWFTPGPEADLYWQKYEQVRGRKYGEALWGHAAEHIFGFDKKFLDWSDTGVLVLPAGKSGHIELGYLCGQGKRTFILFEEEPERWDLMYRFATGVCFSVPELVGVLKKNVRYLAR